MIPEPPALATPPLRLLRVVHTLRRESGGPSESILRSTEALLRLGHSVEITTADAPGTPAPPQLTAAAAGTGATFAFHPVGGYGIATLGAWLRAHHARFDAVLMHGLWQGGWTVNRVLRATRTPYLVFPHGMLDPWFRRGYPVKHLKKQLYWLLREARVLREAAAVCFTCDEERRVARTTFFPYRVTERVVSYGTAGPPAGPETRRAAFAARFPALAGRPFILFLSRIHDKKGLRELIAAHAAVLREQPAAPALVLAGPCAEPAFAAELRHLAATSGLVQLDLAGSAAAAPPTPSAPAQLVWLPMLGDDLKWGALLACEALVLPSHQENFGIAVAEALACGRPALISDKVNIWREITAANAGLVAPDTTAGATDLLRRWHALDAPARAAMGAAARACFLKNFEITNAARSLASAAADARPKA